MVHHYHVMRRAYFKHGSVAEDVYDCLSLATWHSSHENPYENPLNYQREEIGMNDPSLIQS